MAGIADMKLIECRIEMLGRVPFPDSSTAGVDLHDDVRPHRARPAIGHTALHPGCHCIRNPLHGEIDRPSARGSAAVMVLVWVPMLPNDLSLPIHLEQHAVL